MTLKKTLLFTFLILNTLCYSQKVSLYKQFYGSYDFTMLGNTMNVLANGDPNSCDILTESSATLNLNDNKEVKAAYLYWSGNGVETEADLNVKLNGIPVQSERTNYLYLNVEKTGAYFFGFCRCNFYYKTIWQRRI